MLWGEIVGVHQHRGHLLNKPSRACCGPTRNLQCAVVERRENSLWLFNQPVVALGVVCLCSTASNKWISHWQTDAGRKKKEGTLHTKASPLFLPKRQRRRHASKQVRAPGAAAAGSPPSLCLKLWLTANVPYSRYVVFVWTLYCLLHVNGLLTMYGVMRPWVQGQPWCMRVKIGLCCTDDLISIFGGLGDGNDTFHI